MTWSRIGCILTIGLACILGMAAEPPSAPPPDFKLALGLFGADQAPLGTGELVVRKGVAYQFLSEAKQEVQIVDPNHARVILLDLKRKLQTEITPSQLDAHVARLRRTIEAAIETREKSKDRSDRVAAGMSRELVNPNFKTEFDPLSHRLRLANATVEVVATGDPEPDSRRLALIQCVLTAIVKLGSLREPDTLPPFTRLEALNALMTGHKLRPAEVTMVLRLAGPPKKLRWTFKLVAELTNREREAIARVDQLRVNTRFVPYASYDLDDGE